MFLLDIRDDTGVLADSLSDKYLVGLDRRNFTSITPGMTDVRFLTNDTRYSSDERATIMNYKFYLQMLGVLFLKAAGYETVRLHSLHNPHAYWYAFHYEGRHSLFQYLFVTNPLNYPPIPHGKFTEISYATNNIDYK